MGNPPNRPLCSIDGCERVRKSRGLCNTHNERRRRGGSLDKPVGRRGGLCDLEDCNSPHYSLGFCEKHYNRLRRHGDPAVTLTGRIEQNFWAKVQKTDGCWEWTGTLSDSGYGRFWDGSRTVPAHVYSYRLAGGVIPPRSYIDHRCHRPSCVNPGHLRAVTNKQNIENRRGANRNSKSGIRGVSWDASRGKWAAQVHHNYRTIPVGRFDTLPEAEAAVIAKRNELFTHNDGDRE